MTMILNPLQPRHARAARNLAFVAACAWALCVPAADNNASSSSDWSATWTASPQATWRDEYPLPVSAPEVLSHQTFRQVARVSLGGDQVRVVFSNVHGSEPLVIDSASVARTASGDAVAGGSLRALRFGGEPKVSILPGASAVSDAVALDVQALSQLTVSAFVAAKTPVKTFHWDGRQTAWLAPGDQTMKTWLAPDGGEVQTTTTRMLISGIQVHSSTRRSVVATLGDSITDGNTASLDRNTRWPDLLAERLAPHGVGVINAGISGARLLSDGMGVNAIARLERDVLSQPGVDSVIVLLGINDIAWPGTAFARQQASPSLDALKQGYLQLIAQAHLRGVRVIGATLTPFEGALPDSPFADYYQPGKDALRRELNDWIRHGGAFDGVVDFDAALRDPAHPARILSRFDSGDRLHPGDAGNKAMADAVDLKLVLRQPAKQSSAR